MTQLRTAIFALSALALSACGQPPGPNAYLNRGEPESLIDTSSEVVNLSVASPADVKELSAWVAKDRPTRAELNCTGTGRQCTEARKVLELNGVPIMLSANNEQSVTLIYERILARDCENRYVDNTHNHYNTNHPAFGCSVAANIVQHVTNRQEFVSPNLSEAPSAVRAVNDVKRAYKPRPVILPYEAVDNAMSGKAKSDN